MNKVTFYISWDISTYKSTSYFVTDSGKSFWATFIGLCITLTFKYRSCDKFGNLFRPVHSSCILLRYEV